MARNKGWTKIYRSLLEHWLWTDKPFSKGQAWIDLILLANYDDKKIPYKGEVITCERGTVNLSIKNLADRWGWDRKKVKRFLVLLESDHMIALNSTTHRTTITIENYGDFQCDGTTNDTTIPQQEGQQLPTTKNIKNIRNIYSTRRSTNAFSSFPQNDYDFEQLEKELLGETGD